MRLGGLKGDFKILSFWNSLNLKRNKEGLWLEEKIEALFEPFERLDFGSGKIAGTGIGLTNTKLLSRTSFLGVPLRGHCEEGRSPDAATQKVCARIRIAAHFHDFCKTLIGISPARFSSRRRTSSI